MTIAMLLRNTLEAARAARGRAGLMRRLRDGEWIAGAGGIALLASLFLPGTRGRERPWQAFSVLDVVLVAARAGAARAGRAPGHPPQPVAAGRVQRPHRHRRRAGDAADPLPDRQPARPERPRRRRARRLARPRSPLPRPSRAAGAPCAWKRSRPPRRHRSRTSRRQHPKRGQTLFRCRRGRELPAVSPSSEHASSTSARTRGRGRHPSRDRARHGTHGPVDDTAGSSLLHEAPAARSSAATSGSA